MAPKPQPLEAGTKAPAFTAKTFDGQKVQLTAYKGQKVAIKAMKEIATKNAQRVLAEASVMT